MKKDIPYGYRCLDCGAIFEIIAWGREKNRCCFKCAGELSIVVKTSSDGKRDTYRPIEF